MNRSNQVLSFEPEGVIARVRIVCVLTRLVKEWPFNLKVLSVLNVLSSSEHLLERSSFNERKLDLTRGTRTLVFEMQLVCKKIKTLTNKR